MRVSILFRITLMEKCNVPYYQYSLWRPYFLGFTKIIFKHITRRVATLSFTRQRHMKSIKPLYCSYSNSEAFSAATIRFKKAFRIHTLSPKPKYRPMGRGGWSPLGRGDQWATLSFSGLNKDINLLMTFIESKYNLNKWLFISVNFL